MTQTTENLQRKISELAAQRQQKLERIKQARQFIVQNNLNIAHIRRADGNDDRSILNKGGATVAWKHDPRNSFFEISVALCNANDVYNKALGYTVAAEQWQAGHTIRVPLANWRFPRDVIDNMFSHVTFG